MPSVKDFLSQLKHRLPKKKADKKTPASSNSSRSDSRLLQLKHFLGSTSLKIALSILLIANLGLAWYVNSEPTVYEINSLTQQNQDSTSFKIVGNASTLTLIKIIEQLLNKPGGYMSNDVSPPFVFIDNIKNWEFGVIEQVRDYSNIMRQEFTRSQSQSPEDPDIAKAEPMFNFDHAQWIFPASETKYNEGLQHLIRYQQRLADSNNQDAHFYARADNLAAWLRRIESRLGNLSQQLSASVGQKQIISAADAQQNTIIQTPWLEIDNMYFKARGSTWAILHLLKAAEIDFNTILQKKEAVISLQQIIRDLESTQQSLWSPMILNGDGFGMLANHSLVMANYISRANTAIIELRLLLENG